MTAEDAAGTWFTRSDEIIADYRRTGGTGDLHRQAQLAAQGISALLQNRGSELSEDTITRLGVAVDVMAQIQSDTLSLAKESPLAAGVAEFGATLKQELSAGWKGLKEAADTGSSRLLQIGLVVLGILVVIEVAPLLRRMK